MKKKHLKILILSFLFLLTLVLSMLGRKEAGATQNRGSAYQAASLPVMCFEWEGKKINPLYGETQLSERGALGPSVYPFLSDTLEVEVYLLEGRERPQSLSYELRDDTEGRLVAQGKINQFEDREDGLSFPLAFQDILTPDQYYYLDFTLNFSRQNVYYRTRVMKMSEKSTISMLCEYGCHMQEDLLKKDGARAYASHLETDTYSDKETLSFVNLNSNFDQLSWGQAELSPVDDVWLTIEAIQGNYLYLHFAYLAQSPMNNELTATFRVMESISLQRYGMAIYLLNYERHVGQLWSFESNSVVGDGFLLGVQEEERLSCAASANGQFHAFCVNGDLYLYDVAEMQLIKVFSFRQPGEASLHTLKQDYDMKIMEVSDTGQVEFAVFGYMNGGLREGSCGISYCRYNPGDNEVREQMFLHSRQAPATLLQEVGRLFTKGSDNFLYFILDEELLVMDIDTGETAVLVSRAEYPGLVASESGSIFAWSSETDQEKPKTMRVINLKDGWRETLSAGEGEFIRPIGFLREDLVLGYGQTQGNSVWDGMDARYPYYRIAILDSSLENLYDYQFDDILIDHVTVLEDKLELHRYSVNQGNYTYLPGDIMLRSQSAGTENKAFSTYRHETLKKMAVLNINRLPSSLRIEQTMPRLFVEGKELELPSTEKETAYTNRYYAYGKKGVMGIYSHLGEAIQKSREAYGFVLSREGKLSWKWVGRQESLLLEVDETILNPGENWEDVSGASLRDLMCFLHEGQPVRWVSPDQGDIWLIGYEWKNVILYNPINANVFRMLQTDFEEFISRDNNYLWLPTP